MLYVIPEEFVFSPYYRLLGALLGGALGYRYKWPKSLRRTNKSVTWALVGLVGGYASTAMIQKLLSPME